MYNHIPFIEPVPRSDYKSGMPQVLKWHHKKEPRQPNDLLPHFRGRLGLLKAHEVYWDSSMKLPYTTSL
ncbi:hypothetical protein Sjap_005214 [Stephania japonica]|uniref:Uncharacterized protein n=1 Tax=Stephania japonica TaxID=461633 RepID=A0AAP0K3U7_9MAGN